MVTLKPVPDEPELKEGVDYVGEVDWSAEQVGASWEPLDLSGYLDHDKRIVRPEPEIGLARSDELRMIYAGKEHTVIGEMESGKSWLACAHAAEELQKDNRVVYVHFEESDPTDTIERLQALNVKNETILELFTFVAPEEPVVGARLAALTGLGATLVVLDGVNEGMALHGLGIREEDGAAAYRRLLVKPFTARGAAVLNLDHVVKDKVMRGRDPLGSIHKGNGLTGALILLENVEPFGRDMRGASAAYVTKDRPGHLRKRGRADRKLPGKTFVGMLVVDATIAVGTGIGPDAEMQEKALVQWWAPKDDDVADAGGADAEVDAVVAAVKKLEDAGISATGRKVRASVSIGHERADAALDRATLPPAPRLTERSGPNRARVFATISAPSAPEDSL